MLAVSSSKEIPLEQQIDLIWEGAAAVATKTSTSTTAAVVSVTKSSPLDSQLRQSWRAACLSLQSHGESNSNINSDSIAKAPSSSSGHIYNRSSSTITQKGDVEILFGSYLPSNKAVLLGELCYPFWDL